MADERVEQIVVDAAGEDWPMENVTVFVDVAETKVSTAAELQENFAEVTRILSFGPPPGQVEVILEGLPNTIKPESIRAELLQAKGCTILEVSNDTKTVSRIVTDLDKQIAEYDEQIAGVNRQKQRLVAKNEWLRKYSDSIVTTNTKPVTVTGDQPTVSQKLMDPATLQKLDGFMGFMADERKAYDETMVELDAEIAEITKERSRAWTERTNKQKRTAGTVINRVIVLLEVSEAYDEGRDIGLKVIYLVKGAKWKASYDARVSKESNKLQISYYGEVVNGTGEDWVRVNLALSSARPTVAGSLDPLPQSYVFYRSSYNQQVQTNGLRVSIESAEYDEDEFEEESLLGLDDEGVIGEDDVLTASAETGGGATNFRIQRLVSISSDGKPHKQTISIVDLNPIFTYVAAPKMSKHVYAKCTTKNSSNFPFLAGNVAVYIDGSFIAYSYIGSVSKGQEFGFFLGMDPSIKLEWTVEEKKDEATSTGLIKTKKMKERITKRIVKVTNNHDEAVTLSVFLQVPTTSEANIKVLLLEPELIKRTNGPRMNKLKTGGILECRNQLQPRQPWKFSFSYKIEWEWGGSDVTVKDGEEKTYDNVGLNLSGERRKQIVLNKRHLAAMKAYS